MADRLVPFNGRLGLSQPLFHCKHILQ
jgi:hypothetical protein